MAAKNFQLPKPLTSHPSKLGALNLPKFIILVLFITLLLWWAIPLGIRYWRIADAEECSKRMHTIEIAKQKYVAETGIPNPKNPSKYLELLPFLPYKNMPVCPNGGKYQNELDLYKQVECRCNGQKEYEPNTPFAALSRNGYHDLQRPSDYISPLEESLSVFTPITDFLGITGKAGFKDNSKPTDLPNPTNPQGQ